MSFGFDDNTLPDHFRHEVASDGHIYRRQKRKVRGLTADLISNCNFDYSTPDKAFSSAAMSAPRSLPSVPAFL